MADQIEMSSAEGSAPKIPKRIEQIEMTTAEGPAQNIFHQNFNFFGKPVPLKTTFSFNTDQAKLTPANNMKNIPTKSSTSTATTSITNSAMMKDVSSRDVPEVNTTWTPFNTAMAISKDRESTFISWPRQIVQKPSEFVPSGFYYTDHGDVVQCFFCGIYLKHWSRTDRVDLEHRKHSPECKFQLILRRM